MSQRIDDAGEVAVGVVVELGERQMPWFEGRLGSWLFIIGVGMSKCVSPFSE